MSRKRHLKVDDYSETCFVCATEYGHQSSVCPFTCEDKSEDRKPLYICDECSERYEFDTRTSFESFGLSTKAYDALHEWAKRERVLMFTDITDGQTINTVEDVEEFFDALTGYLIWHPDTRFTDYVALDGGNDKPTFSKQEAEALDEAMARCFRIAEGVKGKDVYDLALESAQRAGVLPKEVPYPETAENITPLAKAVHLLRDFTNHLREARDESNTDHKLAMLDGGVAEELIERGERLLKGAEAAPSLPRNWRDKFSVDFQVPGVIESLVRFGVLVDKSIESHMCPLFTVSGNNAANDKLRLLVDHPVPEERSLTESKRFTVTVDAGDDLITDILETDDLDCALYCLFEEAMKMGAKQ